MSTPPFWATARLDLALKPVRLVLQPADFQQVRLMNLRLRKIRQSRTPVSSACSSHAQCGPAPIASGSPGDAEDLEPVRRLFHVVEDIVEARCETMDVLTVDRRDERLVEGLDDPRTRSSHASSSTSFLAALGGCRTR